MLLCRAKRVGKLKILKNFVLSLLPRKFSVDPGQRRQGIRIQISISTIFALLIIPSLGCVIAFSYNENLKNLRGVSERFTDGARDNTVTMAHDLLDPVAATLRVVAEIAGSSPAFFRTEQSRNVLYAALTSAMQIDAFYPVCPGSRAPAALQSDPGVCRTRQSRRQRREDGNPLQLSDQR